ncbi:MAG TPA: ABC transporter ATP-binding protein [Clostridiaceae bacterium]
MLTVNNLVKSYGKLQVLKGISFQISRGKIYGFLGENGAGKTTTMSIIAGLINYDSGEISFNGEGFKKNKRELLRKIGYLPQTPVFYGYLSGYEYLDFIGTISGMPREKIKKRSSELLELVGVKEAASRKIGGYSGGMLQRFGLAVAMFNSPEILILDEPTSSLDPQGRMEVLELIASLRAEGVTVFLSTHILNDIERVCDEVSILHEGKIILSQRLEDLKKDYIQPIYDIEFEENLGNLSEAFKKYSWIEAVKQDRNSLSIYVKDVNRAQQELLNIIAAFNKPVLSFSLRKSNLEDIFIRLVNKNVNI